MKSEAIPITQIYGEEVAHAHLSDASLPTAPSGNDASKGYGKSQTATSFYYISDCLSLTLIPEPSMEDGENQKSTLSVRIDIQRTRLSSIHTLYSSSEIRNQKSLSQ